MAQTFHGIQVYEILSNGNLLNAIYTNTGLLNNKNYDIDNEIIRKKQNDDLGVEGVYTARYIESNVQTVTNCDLEIIKYREVFEFIWKNGNKIIWKGIGLMAGPAHIAVSYVQP